jgi:hypothetical protein
MIQANWHQNTTRIIVTSFLDFLTRFRVERYGSIIDVGTASYIPRKLIEVPVQFSSRDKWFDIYRSASSRRAMDPEIRDKNPVEMQWILPRISCNIVGTTYDQSRKLAKMQNINYEAFTPAPYNLDIEVSVISKSMDDQLQLLEQIVPYFAPSLSLSIKLYSDRPAESVPFILSSVMPDIPVDISENDERLFTFTYLFTVKVNYYMQKKPFASSAAVALLTGSVPPPNSLGNDDNLFLQEPVSGSAEPAVFYDKLNGQWRIMYTLPGSGSVVVSGGLPSPIVTTVPASASLLDQYYFSTEYGRLYQYVSDGSFYISNDFRDAFAGAGFGKNKRLVTKIYTDVHSITEYTRVTDEWIEAQQKIHRSFADYQATAAIPNPFI